ncbi:MAG TPA: DUF3857 domain-containing protein [Acidobacteriota bacterium]|nr:DUF3857 domain-containing protein [Acidobacteriota bacterium]
MKSAESGSSGTASAVFVRSILILFSLAGFYVSAQTRAVNISWPPITDAQRNLKAPVVEKDAGVEAIFWRVHVVDEVLGRDLQRVLYHYVRLKVFNEKGKDKAASIDIPFGEKTSIMDLSGRTVKGDGTVLDLKKDSIFERDLVKGPGRRSRVKSFAMPGVEPGAIVEYRWREIRHDPSTFYIRLQFQREFPVQKVSYFLKPLSREITSYRMNVWPFNCSPTSLKLEDDGFNSTTLENVPGFREEPMMPGEPNVRPWALVFYADGKRREPDKYWNDIGKEVYRDIQPALKTNDEIKRAAAQAILGATKDEDKVLALIRYLRKNLRDLFGPQVTEAERAKLLKQMPEHRMRTSAEVFKSGVGTADELNTLFAAMASQVGLDARPALIGDREDVIFTPEMAERYFLSSIDMAVNIDGKWRLYDVSARLLPSNMLSWREQGMSALVSDQKKPVFVESPSSPPEASARIRSAKFFLSEDGSVEGDVDQEYTGLMALEHRSEMRGDTEARRIEHLKEEITKIYADSDVSAIRIDNAEDPEVPLKIHYHIKVRAYAARTGKRLLIQPLFFQHGVAPLFASAERKYAVSFPYAWMEQDEVSIIVPEDFILDNAENPGSIQFGPPGSYQLEMKARNGREFYCSRVLTFGNKGLLHFAVAGYAQIKALFDEIHRRDNHTIALRQGGAK